MKRWKITIFIWCSLALAALAVRLPIPSLLSSNEEEIIDLALDEPEMMSDTVVIASADTVIPHPPATNHQSSITSSQPSLTLDRFFAALRDEADHRVVRVMHYGDSQIEEDRITAFLRRQLQEEYGGSGVGLIPLHQTIPTSSLRQRLTMNGREQTAGEGPKRYLIYGPKYLRRPDSNCYGPMGQMAMMNDSLVPGSEDLMVSLMPLRGASRHTCVRLLADSTITADLHTDTCYLHGRGAVYGLSLESPTGVIVDNIPMRGSVGTIFTEMDSVQLATFYREQNVRLLILQYGGNFIAGAKTEQGIRSAVYGLRQQILYLQRLAPEADILFVGPSDMLVNDEEGTHSNPFVPLMDSLLETMCHRYGVAYFSLYRAMGGEGSMLHWQEVGLAGSDGVHFTRAGADKAAKQLWHHINAKQ